MSSPRFTSSPRTAITGTTHAAGAFAAALSYIIWGLVPLFWKQLVAINPVELIAHRAVWSLVLLLPIFAAQHGIAELRATLRQPRALGRNLLRTLLLTGNWLVYVWGVNTGHVIECSLGYFLVPLVNVASGGFVLHEHLHRLQWLAIAFAAAGVALLVIQAGRAPWIALALAGSWGGYSLLRKQSPLGSLAGLTGEMLLLAPLGLAFLVWRQHTGEGAFGHADWRTHVLLVGSGAVSTTPLLLFAFGARRIRLTTLGLLQYLAPTVQLGLGVWVYRESFPPARAFAFGFIWAGLVLYTLDNLVSSRRATAPI